MARMIPPQMSEDAKRKSPAEAEIFSWLENMTWGDSIVLYSLPLKEHVRKSFGEIDFVVICEKGVLCVEFKGGIVFRDNGLWHFAPRNGAEPTIKQEGPFWQVQGNMKSLKQYLEKNFKANDPILNAQFACCVMMPDCVVTSDEDSEIIKEITFDQRNSFKELESYFERAFDYWKKFKPNGSLSKKDRDRLATFLRSDFSFVPKLSLTLKATEEQLTAVTDEQYLVISGMSVNPRMLIEGGAGTGKTYLATEQCKKYSSMGDRVLFLCFNSLISNFIRESIEREETDYNIDVYTFHSLLMKMCNISKIPDNIEDKEFFNDILPNKFLSDIAGVLTDEERYDRVVIDEGQDLMDTISYMCLEELIKGGWKKGKWSIYYDSKQNIFNTNKEFEETWIELQRDGMFYPLSVNCRNTKQIAKGNYAVTHVYNPLVMRANGEEIQYIAYKNKQDEFKKLVEEIRKLRSEGISKKEIVILSYYKPDNPDSCLFGADMPNDIGTISCNVNRNFESCKNIRFYTIQAFKGMEAKAVIMIDVDSFSDQEKRLLNYVGMSRARSYLAFIYSSSLSQERQQRLLESLTE